MNFSFATKQINVSFSEAHNKKNWCNILGEKPIDANKLNQFSLKTTPPSIYRPVVWKLLCGITPRFAESQEFVYQQHVLMFEDLFQALKSLRLAGPIVRQPNELNGHSNLESQTMLRLYRHGLNGHVSDAKNPELEHFFLMWLISEARLLRDPEAQLNAPENQKYILVGAKLHCMFDDPIDMYHICASLWTLLRKNEDKIRNCVPAASVLLKKKNESLHRHLVRNGLFSHTMLEEQCLSLFCPIFPESSIELIIDKIFAGCFDILAYLIVALLCQLQHNLYSSNSVESIRNILSQIRKEQADVVITTTLDNWHKREGYTTTL